MERLGELFLIFFTIIQVRMRVRPVAKGALVRADNKFSGFFNCAGIAVKFYWRYAFFKFYSFIEGAP